MSARSFAVVNASNWRPAAEEPGGADEKIWLAEPETGHRWLFKPVTIKNGHIHGEDWAEKAASELARLIRVPAARVEMAVRGNQSGALSLDLCPVDYDMHNGAVALSGFIEGYVPGARNPRGRPGHSLENIRDVLQGAEPPPGNNLPSDFTAFDAFAGILLLDAWIANRDRHDENWSILYPAREQTPPRLCAAYDQAGCLGFNLLDGTRLAILDEGRLPTWVRGGTAWRFEHQGKPITLVELASRALHLASGHARRFWIDCLHEVSDATVSSLLERLPVLSDPARIFAYEVLLENRRRLLDECG